MSIQRYDFYVETDSCDRSTVAPDANESGEYVKHDEAQDHFAMDAELLNQLIEDYECHVKNFGISSVFRDARISIAQRLDGLIAYREKISQ